VECPHRASGCSFTCQRQLLASHLMDSCQYAQVSCSEAECGQSVQRKDISNHARQCVNRLIECDGCGVRIKFGDKEVSNREWRALLVFTISPSAVSQCRMPRADSNLFGLLLCFLSRFLLRAYRSLPRPRCSLPTQSQRMSLDWSAPHFLNSHFLLPVRIHQGLLPAEQRPSLYSYRREHPVEVQSQNTGRRYVHYEARNAGG
jgi:TRAF-type zinc finger